MKYTLKELNHIFKKFKETLESEQEEEFYASELDFHKMFTKNFLKWVKKKEKEDKIKFLLQDFKK